MFSIYTSAFNIVKNGFDYAQSFDNYLSFSDEVVVSTTNNNEDSTLEVLEEYAKKYKNFRYIISNLDRKHPFFHGHLRDEALQECKEEFCICLDLDELLPLWQKYNWVSFARMLSFSEADAYLIPLINLWGSYETIRWDKEINYAYKWALHKNKKGKIKRGPVKFAIREDGTVDVDKSDTCELIYENGDLVRFSQIITNPNGNLAQYIFESTTKMLIYHLGYADYNHRVKVNKNFWQDQLNIHSGNRQKDRIEKYIPTDAKTLNKPLVKHNVPLWNANVG